MLSKFPSDKFARPYNNYEASKSFLSRGAILVLHSWNRWNHSQENINEEKLFAQSNNKFKRILVH